MLTLTTAEQVNTLERQSASAVAGGDILSMILSLMIVLATIVVLAYLYKRFYGGFTGNLNGRIVNSIALGPKERLVVVDVESSRLVLGVTAQQITLLKELPKPDVGSSGTTESLKN